MRALFISELERLWKRKLIWMMFAAIPLIVYATARYYAVHNLQVPLDSPEFVTSGNFPVMALIEQLIVVFNLVSLVLLTLSFTEEYRTGQLRMVLLRAFTVGQLFRAKAAAYLVTISLFFAAYLGVSVAVGFQMFDSSETTRLFHHVSPAGPGEVMGYTLKYYGISLLTVVGMGSAMLALAVICHTTTAAIGFGVGILLLSIGYPLVYLTFNTVLNLQLPAQLAFLSLTQIQYEGIAYLLADSSMGPGPYFPLFALAVVAGYVLLCAGGACLAFTRRDRWI
ncbi:hypothetical protein GCM10010912_37950 [Paenibacillus albidus]|uniref:Uncharacterized protein n=1 Tax=Paenibacillus albidus TaxID=2041023 RepID=A0A917CKE7_9BACL|nr:ABC transporter permease [Paenibacillus albidus]GGF89223.1 hypothetical protein GCM10010912_37950 [Paenibacillus albidus]